LEQPDAWVSSGLLVSSGQYGLDETVHYYVKKAEDKRDQYAKVLANVAEGNTKRVLSG
jgi:hypothetical protein